MSKLVMIWLQNNTLIKRLNIGKISQIYKKKVCFLLEANLLRNKQSTTFIKDQYR